MNEEWARRPISAAELRALDGLRTPIWIYDPVRRVRFWANRSAVRLWGASSLEELLADEAPLVSSSAIQQRLEAMLVRLEQGHEVFERWNFYPDRADPFISDCAMHRVRIEEPTEPEGRVALLVEAQPVVSEVSAAERRSVEALRHIDIMVTLYDEAWRPLVRNPASLSVFGTGESQLRLPASVIDAADRTQLVADVSAGKEFDGLLEVQTLQGPRIHRVHALPTLDPSTGAPCTLVSHTDVTEREALVLSEANARAASETKNTFLANMCHELRTPLNAIVGYTELVMEEAEADGLGASQPDLRRVLDSAKHLTSLIDDVLDIAVIEAGRLVLTLQSVDLKDLIEDCIAWMAPAFTESAVVVVAEGPRVAVSADPVRLRQIVLNLLSNAAKFGEHGQVCVRWHLEQQQVVVEVIDDGPGIPAAALPTLFDKFTQADESSTRTVGGLGLGLAIGRELARAMGGDIEAQSGPEPGTTFRLELPRAS